MRANRVVDFTVLEIARSLGEVEKGNENLRVHYFFADCIENGKKYKSRRIHV